MNPRVTIAFVDNRRPALALASKKAAGTCATKAAPTAEAALAAQASETADATTSSKAACPTGNGVLLARLKTYVVQPN
jgi:hypothetical protein